MTRNQRLRWMAAVLWTILIAVTLTVPGSFVPNQVWSVDKVVHFVLFAGFAFLWVRALGASPQVLLWIALAGLAYGIGSELFQEWMPDERRGDVLDAVANAFGLAVGLLAATLQARRETRVAPK